MHAAAVCDKSIARIILWFPHIQLLESEVMSLGKAASVVDMCRTKEAGET